MTRKDYERLASAIRPMFTGSVLPSDDAFAVVQNITASLANDNPRFDRAWFLKACGVTA